MAARGTRRRRFARRLVGALAVVVAALALLHAPPARRLVSFVLTRVASRALGGEVTLDRLDYRLWAGEASLTGLVAQRPGLSIECERADLSLGPFEGLRVTLEAPRAVATLEGSDVAPRGPSRPWAALGRLSSATLERGRLDLREANGSPWLVLDGVEARLRSEGKGRRASVRIAAAGVGWPGAGVRLEPVRLDGDLAFDADARTMRLVRAHADAEGAVVDASGRIDQIGPVVATGEARGTFDAPLLRRLLPRLDVAGRIEARLSIESRAQGTTGSLTVDTPGLVLSSTGPWSGSLRARLEGERLVLDQTRLRGYGGHVGASGALSFGNGRSDLEVRARGLDIGPLMRSLGLGAPLAARADAEARVAIVDWDAATTEGRGRVALRAAEGKGWPLEGDVDLHVAEERLSFTTRSLRAGPVQAELRGTLSFAKDVDVAGDLRLRDVSGLLPLLASAGLEAPPLSLGGALEAHARMRGRLPSVEAAADLTTSGLAVEGVDLDLSAAVRATPAGIEVESLALQGPDGRASASGFVPLSPGGRWDVHADVPSLVLTDALARRGIDIPAVAKGRLEITGPLVAPDVSAVLESTLGAPADGAGAEVHASGHLSRRALAVDRLTVEAGGGVVDASGGWDRVHGGIEGHLSATDVSLASLRWVAPSRIPPDLASVLTAEMTVKGSAAHPEGEARVSLTSSTLHGRPLPDLAAEARSDGAEVRLSGDLGGRPLLSGRIGLADPWFLRAHLDLGALPLDAALGALPWDGSTRPSGKVEGEATLQVPLLAPRQLRYEVGVDEIAVSAAREWRAGPFTLSGDLRSLRVHGFVLTDGASRVTAEGSLDPIHHEAEPLTLKGEAALEDVAHLVPGAALTGRAAFDLRLRGELAQPDLEGSLTVVNASGRVGALRWEDLEIEASARSGVVTLVRAGARVAGGEIRARGSLPIGPRAREVETLDVDVKGIDLGTLIPAEPGSPPLVAPIDMTARLRASAPRLDAVDAEGRIEKLAVSVGTETLELEEPVAWRWSDAGLRHDPLRLRGGPGRLEITGAVGLAGGATSARLRVAGTVDLELLDPFLGGAARLSGPAQLDLRASHGKSGLALDGEARLEAGRLRLQEPPLVVTDLAGRVEGAGRALRLIGFAGRVGEGRLRAEGSVSFEATGPVAALTLSAEQVPLAYPEGLRSRVSGEVRLEGRDGRYRLGGDVSVGQASFEQAFDGTTKTLEAVDSELRALDERGSFLEKVRLDLRVRLRDGLRVQNSQARLVVDGSVSMGGNLVTPEVAGAVSIREGGEITLSRAKLRIHHGRVGLEEYPARPPILDVAGMTQVTGVRIQAQLSGPLDDLQTSLSSPNRPDLTQGDLATLILTGRTARAAASESGAIVAEEVAAALGAALDQKLGGAVYIDVSRDESLIVEDTDPTQRFNVGVPLSPRLYVIYSQPLDRGSRRWIVDLRPHRELRVRLISDDDGSGAVEVGNRNAFDVWSRGRRPSLPAETRPRVRGLSVAGVPEAERAGLLRRAKLETGAGYDYFVGQQAARRIAEGLVAEGYRTAAVEASEERTGAGAVDVVFHVLRGPRIRTEWSGDDPGKKLRRRAEGEWDPYLPIEETAARRARALRHELQARGHYDARAEAHSAREGDEVVVTFDVHRGPKGKGVDVVFEGLRSLGPEALLAALPARNQAAFFALLDPEGRSRLTARLRGAGARQGFLALEAEPPQAATDASGRFLVTIPVDEGPRAIVETLDVPQEARSPAQAPPPRLQLRQGEPFRLDAYVADRASLASWYREQGYPEVRVVGVLEPVGTDFAVRYAVETGPRPRVGEVRIAEEGRTRARVVTEAVTLEPGDLIRPSDLAESRENLFDTRAFRSVDVRTEEKGDDVRDVVIDLVDRPDLEVEYSLRYTTNGTGDVGATPSGAEAGQLQVGGAIEAVNPFGWAHRYRLYGLAGKDRTLLGASFDAATFFGRRWRTQVFVFDDDGRETDIPQLLEHERGVALQQTKRWRALDGRRWRDHLRMQWGYSYRWIDYTDLEGRGSLAGIRASVSDSLIGDSRDSLTDPHRGLFWTANAELSATGLGSDVDYLRLFGQLFVYTPLGEKVVWAQGLRSGIVPGNDPLLLLDRRFQAGGATTVRGFPENGLGPSLRGEPIGGQAMLVFNEELRFPIWRTLYGGVFYDAGNVWGLSRDFDPWALRQSAGAGLRLMFSFGPVRLDWGYVLDRLPGEQRYRWNFSIGHAF